MSSTIKAKIAALVAKGRDGAASEAEALAAIAMADRLMAEHGLKLSDVMGEDGEKVEVGDTAPLGGRMSFASRYYRTPLSDFCGVRAIVHRLKGREVGVTWVGYPSDIAMAEYLSSVIGRALMEESKGFNPWRVWWHSGSAASATRARNEFAAAMAFRIGQRLDALARARKAAAGSDGGSSLVVFRDAALDDFMATLRLEAAPKSRRLVVDPVVMAAGVAAGDGVHLGRPIEGGSDGQLLRLRG